MISNDDFAIITKLDAVSPEQRASLLKEKPLVVSAFYNISTW